MHLCALPGVVDEDVDAAERPFRLRQHGFKLRGIAHINPTGDRTAAARSDFPGDALGAGAVLVRNDESRTFTGEALRRGGADAAGSAGYDRRRTGKFLAHVSSPCSSCFSVGNGRQRLGGLRSYFQ